jgi:hypothetical protein
MQHLLLNAGLFQATWFAAVVGGTAPACVACGLLAAHVATRAQPRADALLAVVVAAIGFALDTLWIRVGVLDYGGAIWAPPWIVALWAAVGLSLNHSLAFCVRRPLLGSALVAVTAPISYSGGAALGAVTIPVSAGLAVIAVVWAVVFAMLFVGVVPAVNRLCSVTATGETQGSGPR